ncbi:MAG: hypothetical protein AAGJ40_23615, partial [Planctomycetota bacterium]
FDERERLEYIPAKLVVHLMRYLKRACGKCKQTVKVAPPPQSGLDAASLTKGSRYGFGVTAQIILGKYADHLPLYRYSVFFFHPSRAQGKQTREGPLGFLENYRGWATVDA